VCARACAGLSSSVLVSFGLWFGCLYIEQHCLRGWYNHAEQQGETSVLVQIRGEEMAKNISDWFRVAGSPTPLAGRASSTSDRKQQSHQVFAG